MEESSLGCFDQMPLTENAIHSEIQRLTHVERSNWGFEVQLPLFFPNGASIAVTIAPYGDDFVVHDSGASTAFLIDNGISISPKLVNKISNLAENYGCEFESHRLQKRSGTDHLGAVAAIVANASKTVVDLVLQQAKATIVDFKKEVLVRLRDYVGEKRFREDEEVHGESGYSYHVNAVVLDANADKPIGFIELVKDHEAATKKFRAFWDISRSDSHSRVKRISLFDDARHWDNSDLLILQEVSSLVRLSDARLGLSELVGLRV